MSDFQLNGPKLSQLCWSRMLELYPIDLNALDRLYKVVFSFQPAMKLP